MIKESAEMLDELIRISKSFYQKGWMVGTSGNLSARLGDGRLLITASGKPKGDLSVNDFVAVSIDPAGSFLKDLPVKPSAEVSIHQSIYLSQEKAGAVFHIHSIESNVVSEWAREELLPLPPLEMLKGVGIPDPSRGAAIPVFENHLDVKQIASDLSDFLQREHQAMTGKGIVPAFLIRHHGLTVWGKDLMEAYHRIELIEYLLRFMVLSRLAGQPAMGGLS